MHKSKKSMAFLERVKGLVDVLWLPAYSPDMNPIEHLWRLMKSLLSNHFFPTMEEMKSVLSDFFKGLSNGSKKIMNLCSPDYLLG